MGTRWIWTAKDKEGKPVESAPGMLHFDSRGPTTLREMKKSAQFILDNMRRGAIRAALDDASEELDDIEDRKARSDRARAIAQEADPGYTVDEVKPGVEDESGFGEFMPEGAEPVDTAALSTPHKPTRTIDQPETNTKEGATGTEGRKVDTNDSGDQK